MKYFFKFLVLFFSQNFIEGSFRCDYKYSAVAKAWFKHFVIPATWFDARLRCTLEGAILASPTTPQINYEMTHIIQNFFISKPETFTGFHATFSQGDYHTVEGTPLSKFPWLVWAENEPDNKGNEEKCITFNEDGQLADIPCEDTRPYICYRNYTETKVTECGTVDPYYSLDKRTNSCYKFHTIPRTFSRAFFTCVAEGGHLAVINSYPENDVLKELFAKHLSINMLGNFWKEVAFIGFHDWGERMDWRTIHGQRLWEAGYGTFSQHEPNNAAPGESCGSIYRSGQLNDLWCDRPAAFICEKSPDFPPVCKAFPEEADTRTSNLLN